MEEENKLENTNAPKEFNKIVCEPSKEQTSPSKFKEIEKEELILKNEEEEFKHLWQ